MRGLAVVRRMAARCRAELGDIAGAESILRDMARGLDGDDAQRRIVLLELARVLTARGDHAAALETYERSLALFGPGDAGLAAVLLIERNCPFLDVANRRPALCSVTVNTLSRLLGRRVERVRTFQNGHGRCAFRIVHGDATIASGVVEWDVP